MATITGALEREVVAIRALADETRAGSLSERHARHRHDRHFAAILKLLGPRIRHFTRQYGLTDHWEDAGQVCAIGVHRATEQYDPARARFTTFVNWQLRAELQALRYRLRLDRRDPVRAIGAPAGSLDALRGAERERIDLAALPDDADALEATEALASAAMARRAAQAMLDGWIDHARTTALRQRCGRVAGRAHDTRIEARLARDRSVIERSLFGDETAAALPPVRDERGAPLTGERLRQAARCALGGLGDYVRDSARFDPGALAGRTGEPARR